MMQYNDSQYFEDKITQSHHSAIYDDLSCAEMPKLLLLWALRACIVNNGAGMVQCKGLFRAISDWFGNDAGELIHSAQIIAWANYQAGNYEMRFKPTAAEGFRHEEKTLFSALDAINDNNPMAANDLCHALTGALSDIAYGSFLSLARIMRKVN